MWPGNKVELPKKSKPFALQPRLDEEGQIRCDSRLRYAEFLSHDAGFPKILPRRHQVTKLIVKKYHEDGNNASGTNQTSASLSTQIWIVEWSWGDQNGKKSATNAADEKQKPRSKLWLSLIKTLLIASTIFPNSCALWRTFSHNSGKSVLEVKSPFGDGLRIRLWFLLECFLQNCKPKRTSRGDVFR